MAGSQPQHLKTVSEYHQAMGLPKPVHPLVSVIRFDDLRREYQARTASWVFDFYIIALKSNFTGRLKYGQQDYDFKEGIMTFMAPGQILRIEPNGEAMPDHSGWLLLFHPDFLWHTPLGQHIRQYEFFDYAVHEALFLSEKEERIITDILKRIQQEYHGNIDAFTQSIIVSQLEVLLNYAERFYHRQFITRKVPHTQLLTRLETLLADYLDSDTRISQGLPTVKMLSDGLNVSPNYLSALLKNLTGKSTQQHIQDKVIDKAKQQLATTELSVSQIAYSLGFGYAQSFSKLFKAKTSQSPLEFRASFN